MMYYVVRRFGPDESPDFIINEGGYKQLSQSWKNQEPCLIILANSSVLGFNPSRYVDISIVPLGESGKDVKEFIKSVIADLPEGLTYSPAGFNT